MHVGVKVCVYVKVTVIVALPVKDCVGVKVFVTLGVYVGVSDDTVFVFVTVGVAVFVHVDEFVAVNVAVKAGLGLALCVGVYVGVTVGVQVFVYDGVYVGVHVNVGEFAGVPVKVGVGEYEGVFVGEQPFTSIITPFDSTGGGGSSESMPATFVIAELHAAVTTPVQETASAPAHVEPSVQLITLPVLEHPVPPPHPWYEMPTGTESNILGFVEAVRLKIFRLSYFCGPSFAWKPTMPLPGMDASVVTMSHAGYSLSP